MFVVYLLWVTIVFGGLFMGLGFASTMLREGVSPALALNTLLYLGCALYGLPKLIKLVFKKS